MKPDYRAEFIRHMIKYKWLPIAFALWMAYIFPWPLNALWVLMAIIIRAKWV